MYGKSGSHLLTTTGIQSGPDAFNKSRLVMISFANLRVTGVLCSFRIVLEEKEGKEIPAGCHIRQVIAHKHLHTCLNLLRCAYFK